MLSSLGKAAAKHKWWFLGAWILVLVGLGVATNLVSHETQNNFNIPGTESQEAQDLLEADFPEFADASADVVFKAKSGDLTSSDNTTAIGDTVTNLGKISGVSKAINPLESPYDAAFLSKDKTIAYSTVTFDSTLTGVDKDAFKEIEAASKPAVDAGLDVQYSGELVDLQDPIPPGLSEYSDEIGLGLAAIILLVAFGSVVTMGLPIGTAVGALGVSAGVLAVLEHFVTIGSINPTFGTMLGLGVGIDYSLLILNRYLQNRASGHDVRAAAGIAVDTAGRAVIFAGLTISIAVVALMVFGVPYLSVLGFTSAMYVVITVIAALTLLPAFLGLAGQHVESIRLPFIRRRSEVDPEDPTTFWARWARFDARARFALIPAGLVLLAALAIPFKSVDLGFVDDGSDPTDSTERQSYDLISEGFGPGRNGPLLVAVQLPGSSSSDESADESAVKTLTSDISSTSGVQAAAPAQTNSAGTASVIEVIPTTGPSSQETKDLTVELRDKVIPDSLKGTSLDATDVFVGGETAVLIDLTGRSKDRLSMFIAVVLGAAFLLLMIVVRSLLVPLKAIVLNLLMFLAVYGLLVAVFQWGWGKDLIGLSDPVSIESFVPVVVFAVLFGLSTDYEVFLISRIREEFDETDDAQHAVTEGLATTARVIAAAALIMAAVFLSFVTNPSVVVKQIGLPLGVGILLDAFVLRLTVVPAVMHVMGKGAWYLPRWLDRVLPNIAIDAPEPAGPDTT
jgi:RND superfamily putative drug exporter